MFSCFTVSSKRQDSTRSTELPRRFESCSGGPRFLSAQDRTAQVLWPMGGGDNWWIPGPFSLTSLPPLVETCLWDSSWTDRLHTDSIGSYMPSTGSSLVTGDPSNAMQLQAPLVSGSSLQQASYIGLLHESLASTLDHSLHSPQLPHDIQHCTGLSPGTAPVVHRLHKGE